MCWREWKMCAPSLVLACLQCFQDDGSLSFRWSNWQNHRWLKLAETVGVQLVHTSAQVGPPRARCPCPDGFWVSLRMEIPQPPKQPVLLLNASHIRKKTFLTFIQKFPDSHLCHFLWTCQLWRSWKNKSNPSVLLSVSISSLVCRLRALLMHIIHDFPCQLPWNRLGLTVRPRYINWTSDQFPWLSLSVAFEELWKIHCVFPCRTL